MSYNMVSDRNSTTTVLAGGATFTGVFEDVSAFAEIVTSVFTDQISGSLGFDMQGSSDGVNTDASDSYNIPINTNKTFKVGPGWKFFRIVYTNGATPQTAFRLQTNYKTSRTRPSSIRMMDARSVENDFEENAAYLALLNGTSWDRARTPIVFVPLNAVSIAAEVAIWTPAVGKKFRLMGYVLESGTIGGNVLLKDGTGGTTIHIVPFGAANGVITTPPMGNGQLSTAVNNALTATGTATQTLSGTLFGTEE
jgi:hypothetical protein